MPSKNKLLKQKEKDDEKEKVEQEKLLNEYRNEGTNKKGEKKAQLEHEKQMEKLLKIKEKKELEEADELSTQGKSVKIKKSKKNKNHDLEMLKEVLKHAPKTKSQIESEKKQQNIQKGMVYEHDNIMDMELHNTFEEDEQVITGLDNILNSFSTEDSLSFNKFYHQQLPIMKNEYPGLRLTQYQQKIHVLWKKSPLNKNNQI